jgi:hypothetical protein
VVFNDIYERNPLVNVFCLGIAKHDGLFKGLAQGEGNPVLYVGSKTGRDGMHGATMASDSFDEQAEGKRPTVQVGDPFTEKLLLEACLELMAVECIVGIQDMGAAGLTSSSCEMASRAGTGIELDLTAVRSWTSAGSGTLTRLSWGESRTTACCGLRIRARSLLKFRREPWPRTVLVMSGPMRPPGSKSTSNRSIWTSSEM